MLDVSQIPSGVYRLVIRLESGKVDSQLLVIE